MTTASPTRRPGARLLAVVVPLVVLGFGCAQGDGSPPAVALEVEGARVQKTLDSGALYLRLTNRGRSVVVERFELDGLEASLHETVEKNGLLGMQPLEGGLQLAETESVVLEPGGLHVMLRGAALSELEGDVVFRIYLDTGDVVSAAASVSELGEPSPGEHDGH